MLPVSSMSARTRSSSASRLPPGLSPRARHWMRRSFSSSGCRKKGKQLTRRVCTAECPGAGGRGGAGGQWHAARLLQAVGQSALARDTRLEKVVNLGVGHDDSRVLLCLNGSACSQKRKWRLGCRGLVTRHRPHPLLPRGCLPSGGFRGPGRSIRCHGRAQAANWPTPQPRRSPLPRRLTARSWLKRLTHLDVWRGTDQ